MRQGITGLMAGFVAGAVLAGTAAFAVGIASPDTAGSEASSEFRGAGSQRVARSASSTGSAETTAPHLPDDSVVMAPAPTPKPKHDTAAAEPSEPTHKQSRKRSSSSASAKRSQSDDGHDGTSSGTVCAPEAKHQAKPEMHEPTADERGDGEHHSGEGHE